MDLNQLGLIFSIVGSLFVAFSSGKPPSRICQTDKKGREISIAAILHPKLFRWGIIMLVLGFGLMFVETFMC